MKKGSCAEPVLSSEPRRILLVEDEEAHARIIQRAFERYGERDGTSFELTVASSLAETVQPMKTRAFDLVITDWRLPDGEGFDLLKDKPRFPLLVMTSHGNEHIAVEAMRAGALDYIVKSETSLLDMPRIAEVTLRLWTNLVAKEVAQEKLLVAEEALRARKQSEDMLRESEQSLRSMADAMPQIVWTARPDGYMDYFNRRWYEFTGSRDRAAGDTSWTELLHPDDVEPSRAGWNAAVSSGRAYEMQSRLHDRKSGRYRWYLTRALALRNDLGALVKWVGTTTDIDDHKRLSQELEQRVDERTTELRRSIAEKTTLLQEVHHRVKNNLQVVCSLLSMQIGCAGGESLAGPLTAAHSRVLAMSLIHEQIYQSETLADLNFSRYIETLGDRLFGAYCVDPSRIRLERNIEAIVLTIDEAIPCGLILNELMANSLKHAFRDGREGVIRISFKRTGDDCVEIEVADNGTGLPVGFCLESTGSLGMRVVRSLIHQLRAQLVVTGEGGTTFRFTWRLSGSQLTSD
jgi:PAS domain S-box-containing protein